MGAFALVFALLGCGSDSADGAADAAATVDGPASVSGDAQDGLFDVGAGPGGALDASWDGGGAESGAAGDVAPSQSRPDMGMDMAAVATDAPGADAVAVDALAVDASAVDAGPDAAGSDGGPACVTDEECPTDLACGYAVADRCAAVGVCVVRNCTGTECYTPAGTCGCDGQPVEPVQMERTPTGGRLLYTARPYRGIGPCPP